MIVSKTLPLVNGFSFTLAVARVNNHLLCNPARLISKERSRPQATLLIVVPEEVVVAVDAVPSHTKHKTP
jgi:hypothetical protein